MRYQDKVTIVTGGTKGLGEGCVHVLPEAGAHIVFCGLGRTSAPAVADRVTAIKARLRHFIRCDVQRDREALAA